MTTKIIFDFEKINSQFERGGYTDLQKSLFFVGLMVAVVDKKQRAIRENNPNYREYDVMHGTYNTNAIGKDRLMRIVNRCIEEKENEEILPFFQQNFSEEEIKKLTYTEICFFILSGRLQTFLK